MPGYRRQRKARIDATIKRQERDRDLETGLLVVLDRPEKIPRYRSHAGMIPVLNAAPGIAVAQSQWDSASLPFPMSSFERTNFRNSFFSSGHENENRGL